MTAQFRNKRTAKRGGGLRAVSTTLPKVTAKAFGKRGLAEGGLVADWAGVVGSELAAVTLPRRLSYPSREVRVDGTLTLRVAPGHALTVQHLTPLIIEKINAYLGYGAIARLSLQQGPFQRHVATPKATETPLTKDQEAALRALTAGIEDETLRGALERLARAVRSTEGTGAGS